jgi:hypothetical protein
VGAALGARLVCAALGHRLAEGAALDDPALWDGLRRDVLDVLRSAAVAMGGRLAETVSELFLFTIVGVAVAGDAGCVFAAGDGLAAIDGEVVQLGPFPRNEPPYLGYGLLDPGAPGFAVVRAFDARAVRAVLVATDGAEGLDAEALRSLWEDDRHFRNRDALRRTLALWNREVVRPIWEERRIERRPGLLEDDTTVVVVRRA